MRPPGRACVQVEALADATGAGATRAIRRPLARRFLSAMVRLWTVPAVGSAHGDGWRSSGGDGECGRHDGAVVGRASATAHAERGGAGVHCRGLGRGLRMGHGARVGHRFVELGSMGDVLARDVAGRAGPCAHDHAHGRPPGRAHDGLWIAAVARSRRRCVADGGAGLAGGGARGGAAGFDALGSSGLGPVVDPQAFVRAAPCPVVFGGACHPRRAGVGGRGTGRSSSAGLGSGGVPGRPPRCGGLALGAASASDRKDGAERADVLNLLSGQQRPCWCSFPRYTARKDSR